MAPALSCRSASEADDESIVSVDERKGLPCQMEGGADSQAAEIMTCSNPNLPEDIWFSIHSLMPMREAARAACVSRAFLRSWQCRPILIFNADTFGLNDRHMSGQNFSEKVDHILSKHRGIGVKIFKLELEYPVISLYDANPYLDSWVQVAIKPGMEELTLELSRTMGEYNFPCLLLSDGVGRSLRHLNLHSCALHPTAELGPLRNLTTLQLCSVSITEDELERLFYNSLTLEQLDIAGCMEIICLKIPCVLQQFSRLNVHKMGGLEMIDNKAPNLSSFFFRGDKVKLSLGETLQMKELNMRDRIDFICYARTELPSHMPNLVTLVIGSYHEVVNTPMLPSKFLYLKHLTVDLVSAPHIFSSYDYLSLVSFLDASPSLETFTMNVRCFRQLLNMTLLF